MRVLLIEDNPQVSELVKSLLATHCPDVSVIGEADCIADGYDLLTDIPADLWLLDVELKDGNVFDLLDRLDYSLFDNVGIIFLTAFSNFEYVIRAMHKSAVDYLLKPVDPELLTEAIEKVRVEIHQRSLRHRLDELRRLLSTQNASQISLDKLPVLLGRGAVLYLNLTDIICLEGDENVCLVHTTVEKDIVSIRHLGYYKDVLKNRGAFVQVSKRSLVNSRYIARYEPMEGLVYLTDGTTIATSRRGGQQLVEFFRGLFG
jgi:two-component system, LytTR family, response regulator